MADASMLGRFGYLSPFGSLPNVGEMSFLGGIRTERKVMPKRRSKDSVRPKFKRNNKRVIARLKRRKRKMAKASKVRNRRCN